jgi:MFS family permease
LISGIPRIATDSTSAVTRIHWRLLLLLTLALLISYIDRGNMATAETLLSDQLHLSPKQMGLLLSSFYFTYVLAMIPAGYLAERYGAQSILAAGFGIWSIATLLTGICSGFITLLLCRLLLGVGESATFPSMSKLLASTSPPAQLGRANGITSVGYLLGPAVGTFIGGAIMVSYGWRPSFFVFGGVALLWIWPWLHTRISEPRLRATPEAGPSWGQLLRQRGLWAASLGHFAGNYTFYFVLNWLPDYLDRERGLSLSSMAKVTGAAYALNAIGAYSAGVLVDRWNRRSGNVSVIYKSLMALNHVAALGCMLGLYALPLRPAIGCLFVYQFIVGLASPGCFAIPQVMAGAAATARWVGVQNMFGNFAGILAPSITGYLLGSSGSFAHGFLIAALVNILGILGWIILLPRVEPVRWSPLTAAT